MKTIFKYLLPALAAIILTHEPTSAQNNLSGLVFDEYEWDFGNINEVDGKVSHTFTFTNTEKTPIILEKVKPDCGCTASNYSNAPVPPNGKGQIEITFDPSQLSGHFNKKITVLSNSGKNRNLLTIKGHVTKKPSSIEDDYPFAIHENLRAEALHAALGYVENGSVKSAAIGIVNVSSRTIAIGAVPAASANDKIFKFALPRTLAPGEKAMINLTYDLSDSSNVYGMLTHKLYLNVNGKVSELPITLNGIAIDKFSPENVSTAAHCEINPVYKHFGDVEQGSTIECKVEISNTGKSTLIIRNVTTRKNTECTLTQGTRIAPGKSITTTIRMRTGRDSYGLVTGGISFVVNDPARPYREIRVAADVY